MKKPSDLVNLLAELKDELHESSVQTENSSKAVIHIDADDEIGITLTASDCRLLLHSESTVKQMHEALGEPDEASVLLYNLDLTQEVLDALERTFVSVDDV